jgi:hypothetical protein
MNEVSYDARVVHTVRKLKNTSRQESFTDNKLSYSTESSKDDKEIMRVSESIAMNINNRQSMQEERRSTKFSSVKENVRISLDALHAKPKKLATINNFKNKETFEQTGYKTKTDFQKRLMSENNIIKYKNSCLLLIKEDEELKKLCEVINLISFDNFIDVNLFSDTVFLYKLENILTSDSYKNKKEKFFKDEIKKILDTVRLDMEYDNKIDRLSISLENYIHNIEKFKFLY